MSSQYSRVAVVEEDAQVLQELSLHENLVGPAPGQAIPAATSVVPMMQIVAPASLPEGYEFDAIIGDRLMKVQVPPGGVEKGQTFQAPFPLHLESIMTGVNNSIPVGHWRDGLLNLFGYGACHPHCWTSCCCHLLAAGQVISRMKLSWYGRPATVAQAAIAFKIIFAAVVVYFSLYVGLLFVLVYLDPNSGSPVDAPPIPPGSDYMTVLFIRDAFHYIYWITTTVLLTNLRHYIRHKYAIPSSGEWEDCCCSCWCPCFVSAQMLRHTTNYDIYPATCCTETGIPPHVPSIV